MGLGKLKTRKNTKFISVNPVKTGYSAIADEWIGIKPGTDGLFIHAIIFELLKANKIDWEYLSRYTNAPWLVYDMPGEENDGLFARDEKGNPQVFDKKSNKIVPFTETSTNLSFFGEYEFEGNKTMPSFQILAKEYLKKDYHPDNISSQIDISSKTIKKIASELAEVAFKKEIKLPIKWTDWRGIEHNEMIGRPVSMHAMRGISAHSNGFNTCKLIHILQVLLGSIDTPGGFRYKPPFPKHVVPGPKPSGKISEPNTQLDGMPLGFPTCPEDLLVDEKGLPKRIDKAFSWEHPLSAHGLMHMVINNAWEGNPYKIDVLFMYMANMAWNSSMNTSDTIKKLTDKDPETGEYKIPKIIYSDAYYSETVPYADLILPDTTYLERWDCISLLDRPICSAHGAADAIRQPVLKLDRDVKPFQDVIIELGSRLGLPGFVNEDKSPKFPGGYSDYIVNHERQPGIGPLAGWRGDGKEFGKGKVNPNQLNKYIENGCFHFHELDKDQLYYKFANKSYLNFAKKNGWIGSSEPIIFQLYSEEMQKFKLAGQGFGKVLPPKHLRERIKKYFHPIPIWYQPFEGNLINSSQFDLHAITQRPPHMYHSWGSHNAWLRQITSHNFLYISKELADERDIKDDDWIWVESFHKKIKVPCRIMRGVNKSTVWTWNAIGKRKGAWNLSPDAPESNKGFLLNHLISDLLPKQKDGYRYSNSDPITGQASWYDLKVKISKCLPDEIFEKKLIPEFPVIKNKSRKNVDLLKYGTQFKKSFKETKTDKHKTDKHYEFIGNEESYKEGE